MLWLSTLLALSGAILLYGYEISDSMSEGWSVVWFVASILLTELTLFNALGYRRLRKKVVFALLLHFIPVLSMIAYWRWRVVEDVRTSKESSGSRLRNEQATPGLQ